MKTFQKILAIIILALASINAYASSKETWVCFYYPTTYLKNGGSGPRQIMTDDNIGFATNSMWDGGTARPIAMNGTTLNAGEHKCQRIELNTSSKQGNVSHDMYFWYAKIIYPNGFQGKQVFTLNKSSNYYWGLAHSWGLVAYGSGKYVKVKHYNGEVDDFTG
jgi:hypothetical protein